MEKYENWEGLLPEWVEQDAVILAFPNQNMDWRDNLEEVRACYSRIISEILEVTNVVLLVSCEEDLSNDNQDIRDSFAGKPHRLILINDFELNDTWMRDVMPLFCIENGEKVARDFGFNGWGLKFPANLDNTAVRRLFAQHHLFNDDVFLMPLQSMVLEGGAVETDGNGVIMTTDSVICEPNRNIHSENRDFQIEALSVTLVVDPLNIHSLKVHAMEGDDTDGHIDTMARFVDEDTIVYNYLENSEDIHFELLQSLRNEVENMRNSDSKKYKCVPLPVPAPIFDEEGQQLPATYANFLITNGAILVPIYGDPKDDEALEVLRRLKPNYKVVGIDCRPLIKQHGSLHCITMQVPKGFIHPNYLK